LPPSDEAMPRKSCANPGLIAPILCIVTSFRSGRTFVRPGAESISQAQ
jgi:hypothetical protein